MRTVRITRRWGASSLECVIAFTLLSSVLAFATPLVVKHRRLVTSQREYRLALDEVTNQLERLSALHSGEVEKAVEHLKLSEFAAERLPDAKLRGEIRSVEMGRQVTVLLTWEQPTAAPVTLSGWILPPRVAMAERSGQP